MKDWRDIPRSIATSIREFEELIMQTVNEQIGGRSVHLVAIELKGVDFTADSLSHIGNSHSCPVNGKLNFGGRDKDAPTSYLGWVGQVKIVYSKGKWQDREYVDRIVRQIRGLNTGSGGYRGSIYDEKEAYVLEYEARIFIEDFLAFKDKVMADYKYLQKCKKVQSTMRTLGVLDE